MPCCLQSPQRGSYHRWCTPSIHRRPGDRDLLVWVCIQVDICHFPPLLSPVLHICLACRFIPSLHQQLRWKLLLLWPAFALPSVPRSHIYALIVPLQTPPLRISLYILFHAWGVDVGAPSQALSVCTMLSCLTSSTSQCLTGQPCLYLQQVPAFGPFDISG